MIASIKAEWRKNRLRPAFLIGTSMIAALAVISYSGGWYLATHPGSSDKPVLIATLFPDQFAVTVLGAAFPIGSALAIVLGAILAGSEYSWGTMKTVLTQRSGRLIIVAARVSVLFAWMGILTVALFITGAAYSAIIAAVMGHAISWPTFSAIAKGFGAIWLILAVNGAIGVALGTLIRQAAAALGIGLVYLLAVEVLAVRFIDSLNGGAYKWVGDLLVGQNANALVAHLSGQTVGVTLGAEQAVVVIFAWLAALVIVTGTLVRLRDVT